MQSGGGDRGAGSSGGRNILKCHFCPDEFRTLAVRKNHMLRDHRELLFECALCTFANMYRRDLVWHLREHHRKDHGFSDGVLVKDFVHMPKDLRKVICVKCSETEAHESAVWLAIDPNQDTTSSVGYSASSASFAENATADLHLLLFVVIIIILYFPLRFIDITPHCYDLIIMIIVIIIIMPLSLWSLSDICTAAASFYNYGQFIGISDSSLMCACSDRWINLKLYLKNLSVKYMAI